MELRLRMPAVQIQSVFLQQTADAVPDAKPVKDQSIVIGSRKFEVPQKHCYQMLQLILCQDTRTLNANVA